MQETLIEAAIATAPAIECPACNRQGYTTRWGECGDSVVLTCSRCMYVSVFCRGYGEGSYGLCPPDDDLLRMLESSPRFMHVRRVVRLHQWSVSPPPYQFDGIRARLTRLPGCRRQENDAARHDGAEWNPPGGFIAVELLGQIANVVLGYGLLWLIARAVE